MVIAPEDPGEGIRLGRSGRFQRRNFALACAVAEAFLGPLDPKLVAAVAAGLTVPGRLERVGEAPLDLPGRGPQRRRRRGAGRGAPRGRGRRGRSSPAWRCSPTRTPPARSPPWPRCSSGSSAPRYRSRPCAPRAGRGPPRTAPGTSRGSALPRAFEAEAEPRFADALSRARELAAASADGILLVTGSHYLLAPARAASPIPRGRQGGEVPPHDRARHGRHRPRPNRLRRNSHRKPVRVIDRAESRASRGGALIREGSTEPNVRRFRGDSA